MYLGNVNIFLISSDVQAMMVLEYVNHRQMSLELGFLFHHVFSDADPEKHQCPGLNVVVKAATSLALCIQMFELSFFVQSVSLNIDMNLTRSVWMTRSSDLWIGLFLEQLQTRHPLSRSRSVTRAQQRENSKHTVWSKVRLQLKELGFTTYALTLRKSPNLLSTDSDLLTRT